MPNPMNINPPTPGTTTGPLWAQEINSILENQVAPHTHTGTPDGSKLTQDALNINNSLNLNNQALINTKYVELDGQVSNAVAGSMYRLNDGNLYYRNAAGTQVQITNGGSLVPTTATGQGITGLAAPASAEYAAGVFSWKSNVTPNIQYASMFSGDVKIFNNATSNPTGGTRITQPNVLTSDKTLTLSPISLTLPAAVSTNGTRPMQISTAGVMSAYANNYANIQINSLTATVAGATFTGTALGITGTKPFVVALVPESFTTTIGDPSYIQLKNVVAGVANTAIEAELRVRLYGTATYAVRQSWCVYDPNNAGTGIGVKLPVSLVWLFDPQSVTPTPSPLANPQVEVTLSKSSNNYSVVLESVNILVYEVDAFENF